MSSQDGTTTCHRTSTSLSSRLSRSLGSRTLPAALAVPRARAASSGVAAGTGLVPAATRTAVRQSRLAALEGEERGLVARTHSTVRPQ